MYPTEPMKQTVVQDQAIDLRTGTTFYADTMFRNCMFNSAQMNSANNTFVECYFDRTKVMAYGIRLHDCKGVLHFVQEGNVWYQEDEMYIGDNPLLYIDAETYRYEGTRKYKMYKLMIMDGGKLVQLNGYNPLQTRYDNGVMSITNRAFRSRGRTYGTVCHLRLNDVKKIGEFLVQRGGHAQWPYVIEGTGCGQLFSTNLEEVYVDHFEGSVLHVLKADGRTWERTTLRKEGASKWFQLSVA